MLYVGGGVCVGEGSWVCNVRLQVGWGYYMCAPLIPVNPIYLDFCKLNGYVAPKRTPRNGLLCCVYMHRHTNPHISLRHTHTHIHIAHISRIPKDEQRMIV